MDEKENYEEEKYQKSKHTGVPHRYIPPTSWNFFWLKLLYCIPLVGFILLLVHCFDDSNIARRNHARSYWCGVLFFLIIALIVLIIWLFTESWGKAKKSIEKGAKKTYLVVAQTNKKEVKQCSKKKISQFS